MPKYEVTSDRMSVGQRGDVVDLDPEQANIPALIQAGHVKPAAEPKPQRRRGGEDG